MHVQSCAHLRERWDDSQSPACMVTPSWPEDEPTGLSKSVALRRGSCQKSLTGLLVAAHEVGVCSWRHLDVQRAVKVGSSWRGRILIAAWHRFAGTVLVIAM